MFIKQHIFLQIREEIKSQLIETDVQVYPNLIKFEILSKKTQLGVLRLYLYLDGVSSEEDLDGYCEREGLSAEIQAAILNALKEELPERQLERRDFGIVARKLRRMKGDSYGQLCLRSRTQMYKQNLSRFETGAGIRLDTLIRYCEVLRIHPVVYFLELENHLRS